MNLAKFQNIIASQRDLNFRKTLAFLNPISFESFLFDAIDFMKMPITLRHLNVLKSEKSKA